MSNKPTPFPLVLPKKHIIGIYDDRSQNHIAIASYRKHYQAKLKKPCKKHDACIYANKGYCLKNEPLWTNRQKPEWMEL